MEITLFDPMLLINNSNRRCWRQGFDCWVRKIPWRRAWQLTPVFLPENPMDREAWWATVHRMAKSWTQLRNLACTYLINTFWHANLSLITIPMEARTQFLWQPSIKVFKIRKNTLNMESFWKVALFHNHYTFLVHTLFDANSLVCAFTEFF